MSLYIIIFQFEMRSYKDFTVCEEYLKNYCYREYHNCVTCRIKTNTNINFQFLIFVNTLLI
jgi:hypothetical protein